MLKSYYCEFDSNVCRICLDDESTIMFPLFDVSATNSKVNSFADMLNQCTNLQAMDGDDLPSCICTSCKESLNNAYKFKQLAERSDNILRQKTEEKKPKIVFQNLDELKLKIEKIDENQPILNTGHKETGQDVSKIVRKGAIGNTSIQKIKVESISDDDNMMDVEYLDDDYFPDSSPKKKKKKPAKEKSTRTRNTNAIYHTFDRPIPIKLCDELKKEKYGTIEIEVLGEDLQELVGEKNTPRKHERIKTACPICGIQIYSLKAHLRTHDVSKQPKRKNNYNKVNAAERVKDICPICGVQTFVLKAHLRVHDENKPFKCEQCSKTFKCEKNFEMHLKIHSGVKDFVCDICGAKFTSKKAIKRHCIIHTSVRKFACHLCPKKFFANCDLSRHLKVHFGYKPFKCETCSMDFNAKHQLAAHIRMHTGEKPYTCEICNVAFTYKVNLNNHVFKIHSVSTKFKSIYKITPDVLNKLYEESVENLQKKKTLPIE